MIKIEKTEVMGWKASIRGMRNPLESWDKSDSHWQSYLTGSMQNPVDFEWVLGANDLELMQKLAKAGTDESKFARMIVVYADITAPLYWWLEHDTYKVGTVANSCSKMHKIHAKELTLDDFSTEHLNSLSICSLAEQIKLLNINRRDFVKSGNKDFWWQMIQMLPESYNQKRTVMLNYQVLWNMYQARKNHKLDEWKEFCKWVETLPHFMDIFVNQ